MAAGVHRKITRTQVALVVVALLIFLMLIGRYVVPS